MTKIFDLIRDIFKRRRVGLVQDPKVLETLEVALARDPRNPELLFAAARAHVAAGRRAEAISRCRTALDIQPSLSAASILLASMLRQAYNTDEAIQVLRRARAAAPDDPEVLARLRQLLGSGLVPMWHFSMMNDAIRNQAYQTAIGKMVKPGDHVLEIGAGSGLLAMLAARAGAVHVTSCEMIEPIADKARKIIARNGYANRISILAKESTALAIPQDLAEPADVLVAEIIASDLLGEGMLDSYDDARARLLKPGARILPCGAGVMAQLAGSDELERFVRVGEVAGFDLRDFNEFTPVSCNPEDLGVSLTMFSAPFEVFEYDLQSARRIVPERKTVAVNVTASGLCHGVLQWIWLDLAPGVRLENAPSESTGSVRHGHWGTVLHTFAEPLQVRQGQSLQLVVAHDRNSLMFYHAT